MNSSSYTVVIVFVSIKDSDKSPKIVEKIFFTFQSVIKTDKKMTPPTASSTPAKPIKKRSLLPPVTETLAALANLSRPEQVTECDRIALQSLEEMLSGETKVKDKENEPSTSLLSYDEPQPSKVEESREMVDDQQPPTPKEQKSKESNANNGMLDLELDDEQVSAPKAQVSASAEEAGWAGMMNENSSEEKKKKLPEFTNLPPVERQQQILEFIKFNFPPRIQKQAYLKILGEYPQHAERKIGDINMGMRRDDDRCVTVEKITEKIEDQKGVREDCRHWVKNAKAMLPKKSGKDKEEFEERIWFRQIEGFTADLRVERLFWRRKCVVEPAFFDKVKNGQNNANYAERVVNSKRKKSSKRNKRNYLKAQEEANKSPVGGGISASRTTAPPRKNVFYDNQRNDTYWTSSANTRSSRDYFRRDENRRSSRDYDDRRSRDYENRRSRDYDDRRSSRSYDDRRFSNGHMFEDRRHARNYDYDARRDIDRRTREERSDVRSRIGLHY